MARLAWVALAWIAALVGLAAALHGSGSSRPLRPPASTILARSINDAQRTSDRRWRWSAISATSAVRQMVVHVEAFNVDDAHVIAAAIVEPRRDRFDDILVYVHRVGRGAQLAPRRVEWSRRDGYVLTRYEGY